MADPVDTRNDALSAAIEKLSREASEGFADQQEYTPDAYSRLKVEVHTDIEHLGTEMHTGFGDLRTEMKTGDDQLRTEMNTGFGQLRAEMNTGFGLLRTEMNDGFGRLRNDMTSSFTRLERIERKLDQFIDTQSQTNQIMDRRLRTLEQ